MKILYFRVARLFFFAFHFVCVIVVLNIFLAFVIEAFILEFSFRESSDSRPISSLAPRINQMGLAYGSKPVRRKPKRQTSGEEQLINVSNQNNS